MSRLVFVGILLRLSHPSVTEAEADQLISSLADPFTRALVRRQWDEQRASEVVTWEASA